MARAEAGETGAEGYRSARAGGGTGEASARRTPNSGPAGSAPGDTPGGGRASRCALPVELMLADAGRRLGALVNAAPSEISDAGWWVLHELAGSSNAGLPLVDIARRRSLSTSTVTTASDQLAERGWITRTRRAGDRRRVIAAITDSGRTALAAGLDLREQAFAAFHDRLSPPEWQTLQQLLTRLLDDPAPDSP